ncbi:MAG: serine hydrolase domain-containing protein [Bacteroidota bacterium]
MHKLYIYLSSFSLCFCIEIKILAQKPELYGDTTSNKLEKKIYHVVSDAIHHQAFPGCVVYASHRDSIMFFKSYGYHTYDSLIPVKKDDIYDLASITKIVGATLALMKLYEEGLIMLDNPIKNYVEGLEGRVGKITMREALAHQAGLQPWIPYHKIIRKRNGHFRQKDIITESKDGYSFEITDSLYLNNQFYKRRIKELIKKSKVKKNPLYQYSGLFFYLVPEIVLNLTGISFEEYLKTEFYFPLEVQSLGFNPKKEFSLNRIPPTEIDTFFRMEAIHGKVHDEGAIMMGGVSGNAGLFSNAEDLASVMAFLMDYGKTDSLSLLSPQTINLFTCSHYSSQGNRRGLGFDKPLLSYDSLLSSVAKSTSFRSFGHTGYTGTLAWADPENDLIFIFLSNRVYPSRDNKALYQLNVRPMIHQILYDYLEARKIKKSLPVLIGN